MWEKACVAWHGEICFNLCESHGQSVRVGSSACQFMCLTNKTSTYFCQNLNNMLQAQHFTQVCSLPRELWHPQPIIWLLWSCDVQAVWPWAPVCGMMKTLVLLSLPWSISPSMVSDLILITTMEKSALPPTVVTVVTRMLYEACVRCANRGFNYFIVCSRV